MKETTTIPPEVKLQALRDRDSAYAGLFYVAVKTTGVFCRIGCPARTPKPENVLFFDTVEEALAAGFRPCKVCKPLEKVGEMTEEIRTLLDDLHREPGLHVSNRDLAERGIQPDALRRWFKKHHGMTFQAYQRAARIGHAMERMKSGESVTTVALESYESLSGFGDSFKQAVGMSPRASTDHSVILITRIPTPLGLMMAGAIDDKLCLLEFCDRKLLATEIEQIKKLRNGVTINGHCALFDEVQRQLDEYFAGTRREFSSPLDLCGTPFQVSVWEALLKIPYGATRSYGAQARMLGRPEAVRAVGHANGMNRISIVVPCHRVIGNDGGLTGYGGGLERKAWLLNHERKFV